MLEYFLPSLTRTMHKVQRKVLNTKIMNGLMNCVLTLCKIDMDPREACFSKILPLNRIGSLSS